MSSAALEGAPVTAASAQEAGALAAAAVDPPGLDPRLGPEYLRRLTATLVERPLLRAWERAA